mmetsp:Transcript_43471/g.108550  ORF Transcript_43471/g.108550 Transcript_43471/m.108550 type:complete len:86 (-) Transcript_43471:178-435(-)
MYIHMYVYYYIHVTSIACTTDTHIYRQGDVLTIERQEIHPPVADIRADVQPHAMRTDAAFRWIERGKNGDTHTHTHTHTYTRTLP